MRTPGRRAFLALPLLPATVRAQAQAGHARLVIGFPPGGSTDILGRLIAPRMAAALGIVVTPENRSGAAGALASGHVAQAAPDGTTLLLDSGGQAVNPFLMRGLSFDYMRDLAPVTLLATLPLLLVARPGFGAMDVETLLLRLRSEPRHARYGSVGVGSRTQIAAAALLRRAGIAGEHVPYRGGADQVQGLLRGDVPFGFTSLALARPLLADGQLRVLGVSSAARAGAAPDIPTIAEQGFPGFDHGDWVALLAPARTPEGVIARLAEAACAAMAEEGVAARLAGLGLQPAAQGPAHLAQFLATERALMARIIAEEGISLG